MAERKTGRRIPIRVAKEIAHEYGYEQVIIVARKTGPQGVEWCTTYGRNRAHCDAAAKIGDALRRLNSGELQLIPKTSPDGG